MKHMKSFPLFIRNKYNQIKNFFVDISSDNDEIENLSLNKIQSQSYINKDLTLEKKIFLEKRRRYQAYMALDYYLSALSYFDYFSIDAINIVRKAQALTQFFEKQVVTTDLLLFPFFDSNVESNIEIINLFEKYGINQELVSEALSNAYKANKEINEPFDLEEKLVKSLKNLILKLEIPVFADGVIVSKTTIESSETIEIFETAAENAYKRFKTPIINAEILLITMLEAKSTRVGLLLKECLETDINWYLLRYDLMKRLHRQELAIRTDVAINQQYFAYLLKAHLTELQFNTLIEKDCLMSGVLLFRNTMIIDIMEIDIQEKLKKDIIMSMKSNRSVRKYSTES